MTIEHGYAELSEVTLHYARAGDGELILFAHGFPEFWYAWRRQLEEFGRDHLAVAPDMRGYNLSSKPDAVSDYAVPHMVSDIAELARHFGREKFVLVGHDWGGVVAWAFALAHPEILHRLVIVNAPHPALFGRALAADPAQIEASQYIRLFRTAEAEAALSQNDFAVLWERAFAQSQERGALTEADRQAYLEAWQQPGALTGGLNWYRAAPLEVPEAGKLADQLPAMDPAALTVKVPTLVIWGEQDRALLPGLLDGMEDFVPDLTVRRVPDGSHWVVHEQPDLVNRLIREFVAG